MKHDTNRRKIDNERRRKNPRRRRRRDQDLLGPGGAHCDLSCEFWTKAGLPPANFRLATPGELRSNASASCRRKLRRAGIFLAGCGTEEDRHSLTRLCAEIWPQAKIVVGSDRDSGLAAALGNGDGIVVNAGSGSSVTGRRDKRIENAGGWGHILGDVGGGYYLSLQALRLILREYDLHRGEVQFTTRVLRALIAQ